MTQISCSLASLIALGDAAILPRAGAPKKAAYVIPSFTQLMPVNQDQQAMAGLSRPLVLSPRGACSKLAEFEWSSLTRQKPNISRVSPRQALNDIQRIDSPPTMHKYR